MIFQVIKDDGTAMQPSKERLTLHCFKSYTAWEQFKDNLDEALRENVRPKMSKTFHIEEVTFHNET